MTATTEIDILQNALEFAKQLEQLQATNTKFVNVKDSAGEWRQFPNSVGQIEALISQRAATGAIDNLLAAHGR